MSQSARMHDRFLRRLWIRRAAAIVYLVSAVIYLGWRYTIINEQALFLSIIYYASDLIAVLLGAVTIFVSWHYRHRRAPPPPETASVDVFIPTYREPVEMVRRTIEAAAAIRYPHETWLLDDGNRPAMRALAAELGVRYLARSDNAGAKAGNLNHALGLSKGEFIAVFDADHIPQTHALDATLGFFADPRVGMVQAPQDYYNVDALQYMNPRRGGGLWHDQSFFYNLSQPGRDHYDAASCAGTSVVYRRSALEAIGGIPAETVTEDVHTSLKLQKAGYKVPYLNEPIAYGIAAADLADYYRTRLRYGHGNIHALRRENVLFGRGLTARQRLSYLFLGVIYLEGWQQLMVFLVPAIALIFGIAPFEITILNVLIVLLYPVWSYLLMQEVGCGFSRYWTAEIYSMMRFPVHLLAAAGLFANRMVWRTSQKNVAGEFQVRLLLPQIVVMVVSLVAVVVGFYRLEGRYTPGPLVAAVVDRLPDPQLAVDGWNAVTAFAGRTAGEVTAMLSPPEPAPLPQTPGADAPVPGDVAVATPPAVTPAVPAPSAAVPAEPSAAAPAAPATVEPPAEPASPVRPPPRPIDWFEPLTKGYTIDLVIIAGFWALFNAVRVMFVIARVAGNARRTRSGYAFRTLAPVRIETADGERYLLADSMSAEKAHLVGRLGGLAEADLAAGLAATVYLPAGPARVVLHPEDDGWAPGPRTRAATFRIAYPNEAARRTLEDGLYTTAWQRTCNQNDAEFLTPLAVLGRLFRRAPRDRSPWQAGLLFHDDLPEPDLALLKRSGELVVLAAREPKAGIARLVIAGPKGQETRRLLLRDLVSAEPLHAPFALDRTMYRYRTEETVPADNVAVLRRPKRPAVAASESVAAGVAGDRQTVGIVQGSG